MNRATIKLDISATCFCGKLAWRPGPFYSTKFGEVSLLRCSRCAVHRTAILPSKEWLQTAYGTDAIYAPLSKNAFRQMKANSEHIVHDLAQFGLSGGSVLEVGCNSGYALSVFQDRGWRVTGVEVNPGTADAARGTLGSPVYSTVDQIPNNDMFDVIVLSHVLEHIVNPVPFLDKLAVRLRPAGILYAKVPNYGSLSVRWVIGSKWAGLLPFQHVWYFDRRSLTHLAQRAGLLPIRIYSRGFLPFHASSWLKTGMRIPLALISRVLPCDGAELVGVYRAARASSPSPLLSKL